MQEDKKMYYTVAILLDTIQNLASNFRTALLEFEKALQTRKPDIARQAILTLAESRYPHSKWQQKTILRCIRKWRRFIENPDFLPSVEVSTDNITTTTATTTTLSISIENSDLLPSVQAITESPILLKHTSTLQGLNCFMIALGALIITAIITETLLMQAGFLTALGDSPIFTSLGAKAIVGGIGACVLSSGGFGCYSNHRKNLANTTMKALCNQAPNSQPPNNLISTSLSIAR